MVVAGAVVTAFVVSPWPSVLIITRAFAGNDATSEAALEKHVPPGIVSQYDLPYGNGVDERFDINYPPGVSEPLPVILWVHGGGWVGGSKSGIANYLKIVAGEGYATIGVDYSTAPGAHYPVPVRQVNAALAYITANDDALRIDSSRIVLAGDSAGAQIAAQVANITTNPGYAEQIGIEPTLDADQLLGVVLVSGAFDLSRVDLDGLYGWFVRTVLWAYAGVKDFTNDEQFQLASVTPHVSETFPPAFISSGNDDPLEPQAVALAERLRVLGVKVDALFFPAEHEPLPHEYQFNLDAPAGEQALSRLFAFLQDIVPVSETPEVRVDH